MRYLACLLFLASLAYAAEEPSPEGQKSPPADGTAKGEKKIEPPRRPADAVRVRVTRVIDARTIVVKDVHGLKYVRLIGVDAPPRFTKESEEKRRWNEAIRYLENHLLDRRAYLEFDKQREDRYSRLLAYVWCRKVLVNAELVRRGLLKVGRHEPNVRYHEYLLAAQREARLNRPVDAARESKANEPFTEDKRGTGLAAYRVVSTQDVSHGAWHGRTVEIEACRRLRCNVVLEGKGQPSAADLRRIGDEVWRTTRAGYDKVFLFFLLPDQEIGKDLAYARADYTSDGLRELVIFKAAPKVSAPKAVPAPPKGPADAQVVCDKFKLATEVMGSTLEVSVDTDLPDNTVVMVGVSRSYLEKGNPATYSVDYFSEKGTTGKWKSKHRISIASAKWKSALRARQEKMSRLGLGFDVASISDKITVSMVVPINQPDPRFGKRNSKLTGKAVRTAGLRVVEDEIEVDYPLDSPPVGKSPFPSLNPLELEIGQAYIVSRQTPLMPCHSPADPLAALQQMKQIPVGGLFKVLETVKKKGSPWYKVVALDQRKTQIGKGWINSTALLGQELEAYK